MTSTLLSTIISMIIAIVVGIPTFISLRYQLKSKIFFFINQKLKLYDDIIKNIPELAITYNENRIKKNMFLLKGIFIFSGKKDVTSHDIQKGIILKINDKDSTWLTCKIIEKTDNLDIRLSQAKSTLYVDFDLLTNEDYFIIEALGESDNLDISYSHRIANVSKIEHGKIGLFKNAKRTLLIYLIFLITLSIPIWITKPFTISSYDLQATYYDQIGKIVPETKIWEESSAVSEAKIKDSSIFKDSISSYLAGINNIVEGNISENNKMISELQSELNFRARSDSVLKLASKEYSSIDLTILGKTKLYSIDKNHFVKFELRKDFYMILIPFSIVFLILVVLTMDFLKMVIHYFKYKRISALANFRLNNQK